MDKNIVKIIGTKIYVDITALELDYKQQDIIKTALNDMYDRKRAEHNRLEWQVSLIEKLLGLISK